MRSGLQQVVFFPTTLGSDHAYRSLLGVPFTLLATPPGLP